MSNKDLNAATSSFREHPPSTYSIKFENLRQLDDKYESRLFAAGGYNWRLVIYPKGNTKDEGSGFISMYVEIDSKNLMTTPLTQVYAYLIFFVYNKKTDKYFTIKDTNVKRFNALRKVWGLSQGDHCEFGVDFLVAPPLTNWEVVSFDQKHPNFKFSWTLKKFTELEEYLYASNRFSIAGREWCLKLYPKGNTHAEGKWVSMFLRLIDSKGLNADERIYILARGRLLDPHGSNHIDRKLKIWYTKENKGYGWSKFGRLDKIRKAYLDKEGSLKVEIEIVVVSTTKYSPSI
ncbi:uncharacterized protein LOC112088863 [Eutrema salsugineum]|uniref:uncharacterized protein LOC112088863 n=1 Tax=Eutrema salsugineum TaxID=72664 RepID=UPI000CECFA9D|nr:uncharacterized protein LOC112088863 [Eutrema salsugineum]